MTRYRKKPSVAEVEAVQFTRAMAEGHEPLPEGVRMYSRELGPDKHFPEYMKKCWPLYEGFHKHAIEIDLEDVRVEIGDWVVTDAEGERYLCEPDDFRATYEPASKRLTRKQLEGFMTSALLTLQEILDGHERELWEHDATSLIKFPENAKRYNKGERSREG